MLFHPKLFKGLLSLLILLLFPLTPAFRNSAAQSEQNYQPYQIHLLSRQFTPNPQENQTFQYQESDRDTYSGLWLVQFYENPSADEKTELDKRGIKLFQYIPDRTWVMKIPAPAFAEFTSRGIVRWIGPLLPEDRIAPELRETSSIILRPGQPGENIILTVEFTRDISTSWARYLVETHGGLVINEIPIINALIISIPTSRWLDLAQADEVIWIEPSLPAMGPFNDGVRDRIGGDTLYSIPYSLDGTGVDLLVYDVGQVYSGHPAFAGRIITGDSSPVDHHATHVAGTAAGDGAESPIGRDLRGMAPGAQIISYGIEPLNVTDLLYTDPGDIEDDWAGARDLYGADLGTASIGTNIAANGLSCDREGDYQSVSQLIDDIVKGYFGAPYITIWSAGNERGGSARCGDSFYTTPPPSNAKNPIHVGATDSDLDTITEFSSFGPSDDGRIKPTITAPGCEFFGDMAITSTLNSSVYPFQSYGGLCGTSMAAPAVAGLAALMIEQFRITFNIPTARPLPSTIKAILMDTSVDQGNPGPDYSNGYGRVDGVKAIEMILEQNFFEDSLTNLDEIHEYTYIVAEGAPELRVSLAWDDEPASPLSSAQLVNDLDLSVTSPDGQDEFFPFVLDPNFPANYATTGTDHLNNQEQIIIPNPEPGTWKVKVTAYSLPFSGQKYSIVYPGAFHSLALNEVIPSTFKMGDAEQTIILKGTSFTIHSQVFWNSDQINDVSFQSPGELHTVIPSSYFSQAGYAEIKVVNPGTISAQSQPFQVEISSTPTYLPVILR